MGTTLACHLEIWSPAYLELTTVKGHFPWRLLERRDFSNLCKITSGLLGSALNAEHVYEASCLHLPECSLFLLTAAGQARVDLMTQKPDL